MVKALLQIDCGVVLEDNLAEVLNPAQFDISSLGGAGTGLSGSCANRGPIYFSAQTNTTGVYTVAASISALYGSGYGTPQISVSTSTSSSGTTIQ